MACQSQISAQGLLRVDEEENATCDIIPYAEQYWNQTNGSAQ